MAMTLNTAVDTIPVVEDVRELIYTVVPVRRSRHASLARRHQALNLRRSLRDDASDVSSEGEVRTSESLPPLAAEKAPLDGCAERVARSLSPQEPTTGKPHMKRPNFGRVIVDADKAPVVAAEQGKTVAVMPASPPPADNKRTPRLASVVGRAMKAHGSGNRASTPRTCRATPVLPQL